MDQDCRVRSGARAGSCRRRRAAYSGGVSDQQIPQPPPPRGTPLRDRPVAQPGAAPEAQRATPQRHCWVTGPAEEPGPWPGLLLAWRRASSGQWEGQVQYVVDAGQDPVVVQQWVVASLISAAAG